MVAIEPNISTGSVYWMRGIISSVRLRESSFSYIARSSGVNAQRKASCSSAYASLGNLHGAWNCGHVAILQLQSLMRVQPPAPVLPSGLSHTISHTLPQMSSSPADVASPLFALPMSVQ